MSTNVTMPSMGFDMTEGKVSRWLKNIGDPVTRNETIGEIETEKATVDLIAPVDGVFAQILVQPGETVAVNTPIAVIGAQGEAAPAPPTASAAEATNAQAETPGASQASAPPAVNTATAAPAAPAPAAPAVNGDAEGRIKVSPVARNMAKSEGIDLTTITGSGPGGRIVERDVTAAIQARGGSKPATVPSAPATLAAPVAKPAPAPAAPIAVPTQLTSGEQPLSKMRQVIARRLLESKSTIPHYYLTMEIFMDDAMKLREQLNALVTNDAEKVSVNDLVVAAVAQTLRKFPNVNAYFKGDRIELHDFINVGIAVSVEDGLLTPVLYNADQKSLKQIAVETKELSARARANKMHPQDLGPGTFTVSNLGMFGIEEFAAIINPPESGILAVGAVRRVPVVIDDQIQIARVMKVTLSADHRIVDGALGAKFLQDLKKLFENPVNLLLS